MTIARSQPSLMPQWRVTLVTGTLYTENITEREAVLLVSTQAPEVRAWLGVTRYAGQVCPVSLVRLPAQDWS